MGPELTVGAVEADVRHSPVVARLPRSLSRGAHLLPTTRQKWPAVRPPSPRGGAGTEGDRHRAGLLGLVLGAGQVTIEDPTDGVAGQILEHRINDQLVVAGYPRM